MNATILAIRAITSIYAQQLLLPVLWIGVSVYVLVLTLVIWIASISSPWWTLLAVVPTVLIVAGIFLWVVVWALAQHLAPPLNAEKRQAAKQFIAHISRVAEQAGTPKFVLIMRVIQDVVFAPDTSRTFIGEIASTPGDMHRDFERLRELFR